jgi:uncharacterized protein (DUF305 family)
MRHLFALAAAAALLSPPVLAQSGHEHHHHDHGQHTTPMPASGDHSGHGHDIGPAGSTYDLRWIDAMVQHHTGALRMSEFVFNVGSPGVGALANRIWNDQAQEIKAMGQWRKAWYPQAPIYPVTLPPGGDPNSLSALQRMSAAEITAMQMTGTAPSPDTRVTWFLEGMIEHHGGALEMAHDALRKSSNPTIRRLAQTIIVSQRREIIELRRMLRLEGIEKS